MNRLSDETFAMLAALLVLFTALLNPVVSAVLAVALLLIYLIVRSRRRTHDGP
jgi:hypothetical protein